MLSVTDITKVGNVCQLFKAFGVFIFSSAGENHTPEADPVGDSSVWLRDDTQLMRQLQPQWSTIWGWLSGIDESCFASRQHAAKITLLHRSPAWVENGEDILDKSVRRHWARSVFWRPLVESTHHRRQLEVSAVVHSAPVTLFTHIFCPASYSGCLGSFIQWFVSFLWMNGFRFYGCCASCRLVFLHCGTCSQQHSLLVVNDLIKGDCLLVSVQFSLLPVSQIGDWVITVPEVHQGRMFALKPSKVHLL